MEKTFQIGEIARFFDLAPSTLRYWEECGILAPDKNKGNTAQMQRYALPDSYFVESNRITPYFCPQERTNSSRQTGSVSQNQIC